MAGLLNNITQNDDAGDSGARKIPIIGNFFKSKADRAEQTELMVLDHAAPGPSARPGRGAGAADRSDASSFRTGAGRARRPGGWRRDARRRARRSRR